MKKTQELIGQHGIKFDNMVSAKYSTRREGSIIWVHTVHRPAHHLFFLESKLLLFSPEEQNRHQLLDCKTPDNKECERRPPLKIGLMCQTSRV